MTDALRIPRRVRHELKFRTLTVASVEDLTPGLRRVVLEGEVWLVLDSGEEKLMRRGDISVQRGTNHAWRNKSTTSWARMMYVLLESEPLEVNGAKLGEDLGTMKNVKSSE